MELNWEEALEALTAERDRAEKAIMLIKRLSDPEDFEVAAAAYWDGRT